MLLITDAHGHALATVMLNSEILKTTDEADTKHLSVVARIQPKSTMLKGESFDDQIFRQLTIALLMASDADQIRGGPRDWVTLEYVPWPLEKILEYASSDWDCKFEESTQTNYLERYNDMFGEERYRWLHSRIHGTRDHEISEEERREDLERPDSLDEVKRRYKELLRDTLVKIVSWGEVGHVGGWKQVNPGRSDTEGIEFQAPTSPFERMIDEPSRLMLVLGVPIDILHAIETSSKRLSPQKMERVRKWITGIEVGKTWGRELQTGQDEFPPSMAMYYQLINMDSGESISYELDPTKTLTPYFETELRAAEIERQASKAMAEIEARHIELLVPPDRTLLEM